MLNVTELAHLRSLADPVLMSRTGTPHRRAARAMARAAWLVVSTHGVEALQRSCARLAIAGTKRFPESGGGTMYPLSVMGAVAEALNEAFGRDAVTAALAFWASERDPAVLDDVVAAA